MIRLRNLTGAAALLAASVAASVLGSAPASAAPSAPVVRVMPLGDSITYGEGSSNKAGYRLLLQESLAEQSRFAVDFVGSRSHGPMADAEHEGHAGYTIERIRAEATRWVASAEPDVVLLHIGINDLNQGVDPGQAAVRATALVDQIFAARPGVTVIMEGLVPGTPGWQYQDLTRPVAQFNQSLKRFAEGQPAERRFRFVDAPGLTSTQMADGLHPNDAGYARLAQPFATSLQEAYTADWFTGGPARPNPPRLKDTVHLQRIAASGNVWNAEGDFTAGRWSPWSNQGAPGAKGITSAGTGRVNRVFALGGDNKIYENDGDYAVGTWSGWFAPAIAGFGARTFSALSASSDGQTVHLVAIGTDGRLYSTEGDFDAGRWNGWTDRGGAGLKRVTSATTTDRVHHVFATDADGQILEITSGPGKGVWGNWGIAGPHGGAKALDIAASSTDSTIHLSAIRPDGRLLSTDGDYALGRWNGWNDMNAGGLKRITSAAANGVNHLFAVTGDNRLIQSSGDYNTNKWTPWAEAATGGIDATSATASFTYH
ncbi:GDSL-type esterase/lipase family protein [Streptomyces sp. NPDC058655]|uniref:GDSL-type esterase/lipase family protein n=1 Tax=Streptomyces sp. NPDC058655 TaxID=3346577 RepID=UPI003661FBFB